MWLSENPKGPPRGEFFARWTPFGTNFNWFLMLSMHRTLSSERPILTPRSLTCAPEAAGIGTADAMPAAAGAPPLR